MKKKEKNVTEPDMQDEYDFRKGVRGKYAERFAEGTNLVAISPDLLEIFPDSDAVNKALRTLVEIARKAVKKP